MLEDWKYRPARDLGLHGTQRARSVRREARLVSSSVNLCWRLAMRAYLAMFHRLEIEGSGNLPAISSFVLVANHGSHLDAIILASSLPFRRLGCVFPIAAGDTFFDRPLLASFASNCLNALPIWRKRSCGHSLEELRERLLSEQCIFIVFPEGTRTRSGEMAPFKPGFGSLVCATETPVVPCFISGAWSALPPGGRIPRPRSIRVKIGAPLMLQEMENTRQGWAAAAQRAEEAVRALAAE